MYKNVLRQFAKIGSLTFLIIILDQLSKSIASNRLKEEISLIPNFFMLKFRKNSGIAFSIDIPRGMIIFMTIFLLLVGLYLALKYLDFNKKMTIVIVSFIGGGALSNFIDRLWIGEVIDFISIYKYPVFNVADSFITIGCLLLILFSKTIQKNEHE